MRIKALQLTAARLGRMERGSVGASRGALALPRGRGRS